MASFNQSPTGQTSVVIGTGNTAFSVGNTPFGITAFAAGMSVTVSSASVSLAYTAPVETGFFPSYRRPNRTVTA